MSTIPAIQSAYQGIQNGMQSLNKNAFAVASESTKGGDFVTPMVEMNRYRLQQKLCKSALIHLALCLISRSEKTFNSA